MKKIIFLVMVLFGLIGCSQQEEGVPGYVEADFRYISTNFSGTLQTLAVTRGDAVKSQQLLFTLEPRPESDLYKQAEATFNLADLTLKRRENLWRKGSVSEEQLDQARSERQRALATLTQMQWSEAQKQMYAPDDAFIFDTYFLPGELVLAGQPVVSLLTPKDIYIVFYVTEPELGQLKLGQPIHAACSNCIAKMTAKITYISPKAEYTSPLVYTNRVKPSLVYRIEASPLSLKDAESLHPGQPMEIDLK